MRSDLTPFDDIRHLIETVPAPDSEARQAVRRALEEVPCPKPPLGSWDKTLAWLAGWQGTATPVLNQPLIAVFAGTHGVVEKFIDAPIIEVAKARVETLTQGQASIRGMSRRLGAAFKVYEMGLEHPVPDLTETATLSERDCAAAMAFGMEVVAEGADIIVLGNAGLGSATAAAAIARDLYGGTSEYWAGAHDRTAKNRIAAVEAATSQSTDEGSDPLTTLRRFGGRDIAGLVGAIVAARHQSIPVILDGFVVCAAAAVIHAINPNAISHCLAGHITIETAHGALLDRLGLAPIHESGIPIGDGTGAAIALGGLQLIVDGFATLTG